MSQRLAGDGVEGLRSSRLRRHEKDKPVFLLWLFVARPVNIACVLAV